MIRGVLLDVDGTLVDSNDAHARAILDALEAHGIHAAYSVVRSLIGMGTDRLLAAAGLTLDQDTQAAVSEAKKQIFRERYLPHLQPFPRVRELVTRIKQEGLEVVAASSASEEELEALLDRAGVADLVLDRTSASEVQNSKPAPDIVVAALRKSGCDPSETVMIGDTPYDVQSATAAGVPVIALRCGGWSDPDLTGAVAIYTDPADLLANYDRSPLSLASSLRHCA